jgi:hypothetical protein
MDEDKKRSFYLARTKRIAFFTILSIIFVVASITCFYYAWQYGDEWNWQTIVLVALGFLFILLFIDVFAQVRLAIIRRGYTRPVATGQSMNSVMRSIFNTIAPTEFEKTHPVEYRRSFKTVKFDDGSSCDVDLGKLYFILLREDRFSSVLPWSRSVVREGMSKREWAAIRQLLLDANVVDVDGRGSMKLNTPAWGAVEKIKQL